MAISINIRYYVSQRQNNLFAYMLRVVAIAATEMSKEVFVFQRNVAPAETANAQPTDQFICLADPVDLEDIPVGSPNLPAEMPYYRTDTVDLMFRSMEELEDTRSLIDSDVQGLVNSLKLAAILEVMEDKTYV